MLKWAFSLVQSDCATKKYNNDQFQSFLYAVIIIAVDFVVSTVFKKLIHVTTSFGEQSLTLPSIVFCRRFEPIHRNCLFPSHDFRRIRSGFLLDSDVRTNCEQKSGQFPPPYYDTVYGFPSSFHILSHRSREFVKRRKVGPYHALYLIISLFIIHTLPVRVTKERILKPKL